MASARIIFPFLALVCMAFAGFDAQSSKNLAVYWGQNSYGQGSGNLTQQRLGYYCNDANIDIFLVSFVTMINGVGGVPQVNFANQGNNCTTFPGTDLLNCPEISADIKECQRKGKTILLSIGGATYSEGGFRSEEAAVAGADMIWETFGSKKNGSSRPRPFGDAVIDGFDFDFEATVLNMVPFANRLRTLMTTDISKQYYLTAAPQCPYPDWYNKDMLEGKVDFDAVLIQFYNNYCGLNAFKAGEEQQNFNFKDWDNWAKTVSKNKKVKVLVGAPANTGAAGSGYVDAARLGQVIEYSRQFSSFGGVMLWDASQGYANGNFIGSVKAALSANS